MSHPLSSLNLDPFSDIGIAGQIRARVVLLVADGVLEPGDRLPSVRALAKQLGVNVNTVRSAYSRLETDGMVQTRHGVGTVVLPAGARELASGSRHLRSDAVAVVIGGLDPFYLSVLRGIEDEALERGTLVLVADARDSADLADAIIPRLIARGVDGVIAASIGGLAADASPRPAAHESAAPPIVYVDQPDRSGHVLIFDADRAGHLATRHLVEHGRERIGIVTAPRSWPNVKEVYEGYLRAVEEEGLTPFVAEVGGFTFDAGRSGLAQLLELPDPPSAVFTGGAELALGVLAEAKARGIDVPGDLAIIGYTDSPTAALVDPALTMVSVPAREIGRRAMRTLDRLIRNHGPRPGRTVLDVELVVRGSCGPH